MNTNNFNAQFKAQRPLPKKEVLKIKAGTWIELKWDDASNTIALLLEKPENRSGDVSLHVFDPETRETSWHPVHSQVTKVLGHLEVPSYTTSV